MCTAFIPSWNPGPIWSISPCDPITVQPMCVRACMHCSRSKLDILIARAVQINCLLQVIHVPFPIALKCLVHCRKTWFGFSYRLFPSAVNHTGSLSLSVNLWLQRHRKRTWRRPILITVTLQWLQREPRDKTEQRHRSDWCVLHSCPCPLCPLSALHECLPLFLMLQQISGCLLLLTPPIWKAL